MSTKSVSSKTKTSGLSDPSSSPITTPYNFDTIIKSSRDTLLQVQPAKIGIPVFDPNASMTDDTPSHAQAHDSFLEWQTSILLYLQAVLDVSSMDILTDVQTYNKSYVPVPTEPNNVENIAWMSLCRLLKSFFNRFLGTQVKNQITNANACTPAEIWSVLTTNYGMVSANDIAIMNKEINDIYLRDYPSLDAYVDAITTLQNRLVAAGAGLSDGTIRDRIINGLTEEYETIINSLNMAERPTPLLSSVEVVGRLKSQHRQNKAFHKPDGTTYHVNQPRDHARGRQDRQGSQLGGRRDQAKCQICVDAGKPAHAIHHSTVEHVCGRCGRKGVHSAVNCTESTGNRGGRQSRPPRDYNRDGGANVPRDQNREGAANVSEYMNFFYVLAPVVSWGSPSIPFHIPYSKHTIYSVNKECPRRRRPPTRKDRYRHRSPKFRPWTWKRFKRYTAVCLMWWANCMYYLAWLLVRLFLWFLQDVPLFYGRLCYHIILWSLAFGASDQSHPSTISTLNLPAITTDPTCYQSPLLQYVISSAFQFQSCFNASTLNYDGFSEWATPDNLQQEVLQEHTNVNYIFAVNTLDYISNCQMASSMAKPSAVLSRALILDSGCTQHIVNDLQLLICVERCHMEFIVANGAKLIATHVGILPLHLFDHANVKSKSPLILHRVYYAPQLQNTLLSINRLTDNNAYVGFGKHGVTIHHASPSNPPLGWGRRVHNAWLLNASFPSATELKRLQSEQAFALSHNMSPLTLKLLHERMGHPGRPILERIVKSMPSLMITDSDWNFHCEACVLGKATTKSLPQYGTPAMAPLERISGDLIVSKETSHGGNQYMALYVDNYSKYVSGFLQRDKSAQTTARHFQRLIMNLENITGNHLKVFRSDLGGEFNNKEFDDFLQSKGISRQYATPGGHHHGQNGCAERHIRTVCELAASLIQHAQVSPKYWGEALLAAIYMFNRYPGLDGKCPRERMFNEAPPDRTHFRVWGCIVYVPTHRSERGKWEPKAQKGRFVGYDSEQKAYRIRLPTGRIITSPIPSPGEQSEAFFWEDSFNMNDEHPVLYQQMTAMEREKRGFGRITTPTKYISKIPTIPDDDIIKRVSFDDSPHTTHESAASKSKSTNPTHETTPTITQPPTSHPTPPTISPTKPPTPPPVIPQQPPPMAPVKRVMDRKGRGCRAPVPFFMVDHHNLNHKALNGQDATDAASYTTNPSQTSDSTCLGRESSISE